MGLRQFQDEFDVVRVFGQAFFRRGDCALFIGQGVELASEGGFEFRILGSEIRGEQNE